jgi:hypothetical protein
LLPLGGQSELVSTLSTFGALRVFKISSISGNSSEAGEGLLRTSRRAAFPGPLWGMNAGRVGGRRNVSSADAIIAAAVNPPSDGEGGREFVDV